MNKHHFLQVPASVQADTCRAWTKDGADVQLHVDCCRVNQISFDKIAHIRLYSHYDESNVAKRNKLRSNSRTMRHGQTLPDPFQAQRGGFWQPREQKVHVLRQRA